jgi:hypothetical protein
MDLSVRLTSEDVKKVVMTFSGRWKRYRTPYGTVRAAEAHDEFEVLAGDGVLVGDIGDFVCIDETTMDCWVEDPFNFKRMYTLVSKESAG